MKTTRGVAALLLTVAIWGSTFAIAKIALVEIGPFSLNVLRHLVAFLLLAPLAHRQGYRLRQILNPTYVRFGLTGVALYYSLQNLALVSSTAVNAVLVLAVIPALSALLAAWRLKERITRKQALGIAAAVAGTLVVGAASSMGRASGGTPWLGNSLLLGSAVAWSIYTIQGKRLVTDQPPLVITTGSIGSGLLLLLPLGVGEVLLSGLPRLSLPSVAATLYLGIVSSALTMFLWNYALRSMRASVASLYLNLIPLVGVIIALAMGEPITLGQILGGILTVGGVLFCTSVSR